MQILIKIGRYYSSVFIVLLGKQFFKIVGDLMSIIIGKDFHTNSENLMGGEVVYCPNSNNLTRTLVLLHNSGNPLEEFIGANYLIYLVKPLIICPTLMLL